MTSLRRPNSNHRKPPYHWESLYVIILWWHPRRRHLWSDKKTQMKNLTSGKPSHWVAIINPLKYDIVGETNVCFLCCPLNKATDYEGRSWLTVYLCASDLVLTHSEYKPSAGYHNTNRSNNTPASEHLHHYVNMNDLNDFVCCMPQMRREFRAKLPTNNDRHGTFASMCKWFQRNHPPIHLKWIEIFGMSAEPR